MAVDQVPFERPPTRRIEDCICGGMTHAHLGSPRNDIICPACDGEYGWIETKESTMPEVFVPGWMVDHLANKLASLPPDQRQAVVARLAVLSDHLGAGFGVDRIKVDLQALVNIVDGR